MAECDVAAPRSPAPAVATAARLLDALAGHGGTATLDELTRSVGEPRSSVHRVLTTLVGEGVVYRGDRRGGYRLGPKLVDWGSAYLRTVDLFDEFQSVARPIVADLNETLQLAILEWPDVVYVAKVDSSRQVRLVTEIGRRIPAHASAAGKVLLAWSRDAVSRYQPFTQLTSRTLRGPGALAAELDRVHAHGFAEETEESAEHLCCLAAPVLGAEGAVAAISICVACSVLEDAYKDVLAGVVKGAAQELSRRLGNDAASQPAPVEPERNATIA